MEITPWIECDDGSAVRMLNGEVVADVFQDGEIGPGWFYFVDSPDEEDQPTAFECASKQAGMDACDEELILRGMLTLPN